MYEGPTSSDTCYFCALHWCTGIKSATTRPENTLCHVLRSCLLAARICFCHCGSDPQCHHPIYALSWWPYLWIYTRVISLPLFSSFPGGDALTSSTTRSYKSIWTLCDHFPPYTLFSSLPEPRTNGTEVDQYLNSVSFHFLPALIPPTSGIFVQPNW